MRWGRYELMTVSRKPVEMGLGPLASSVVAENDSGRKVARAAQVGKRTKVKVSNGRVFPFAVSAVVILGVVSVFFSRREFTGNVERPPRANADHWHMAFGIYDCDKFLANIPQPALDPDGIHTHGDGVIHAHPFNSSVAGRRATIQKYFDVVEIDYSDNELTVPGLGADGGEFRRKNGDKCPDGRAGEWHMNLWDGATDTEPREFTQGFGIQRFTQDGMFVTLAFVPEGVEVPQPPSAANLAALGAVDGAPVPVTEETGTTTLAPGDSTGPTSSVAGATGAPTTAATATTVAGTTAAPTSAAPTTAAPTTAASAPTTTP
jgi:hypothetical protein